jgi:hypothetical protein
MVTNRRYPVTAFGIAPEQSAWLQAEADRRRMSKSALIREIIDRAMKRQAELDILDDVLSR